MDPPAQKGSTPDLRDYLRPIWRRKFLVLALVGLVTTVTYVHYKTMPALYRATTDVYLRTSGPDSILGGSGVQTSTDPERQLQNQARILRSTPVAARVAKDIGYSGPPEQLLQSVVAVPNAAADFMTIAAIGSTPEDAARLANSFARAFLEQTLASARQDAETALLGARRAYQDLITQPSPDPQQRRQLIDEINRLEVLRSLPSGDAQQLDAAAPPGAPFTPRPRRNALFALALSMAFAIMAAYGLDRLDRRIHQLDAVKPMYEAPVIAAIPRADVTPRPPASLPPRLVEAFRTLRTALEMALPPRSGPPVILVSSAVAREGKSTVVQNLALVYHEAGKRVAIVEADLRHPALASSLFTAASPGLADVLQRKATLDEALHEVVTDVPRLELIRAHAAAGRSTGTSSRAAAYRHIKLRRTPAAGLALIPSGDQVSDPPTLLGSQDFKLVLEELKAHYDIVLIDSTPLLQVSDAIPLLAEVDGTLLVSRVGKTTEQSAMGVADLMSRIGGPPVVGVVANDVVGGSRPRGFRRYTYAKAV